MKKVFFALSLLTLFSITGKAQTISRTIKVHFHYGSKPAKGFKYLEKKLFGGIKGGHVSIEVDDYVIGFEPKGEFHVYGNDRERHSHYVKTPVKDWVRDTISRKYLTVIIPVSEEQYQKLKKTHASYFSRTPYDYAFFGYRCASSTYDILAQINLVKKRGRHSTVIKYFYPKRVRSLLIRDAQKNNYQLVFKEGRKSRKWEKDRPKDKRIIQKLNHPVKKKVFKKKYA